MVNQAFSLIFCFIDTLRDATMSESESTHSRLNKLEEVFTHHQVMLDDLNEVIIELRSQLDRLQTQRQAMEATVQWLVQHQQASPDLPHEKPPHY